MKHCFLTTLAALLLMSAMSFSQTPPPMPKPGPEQQKLEYFAGTWKTEGDMKPGPMGPGGKFTSTTKGEMMNGFFLILNSEMNMGSMGGGKGMAVMGYRPEDKKYSYYEVNSWGEEEIATGVVDGNTWTWSDEHKMGGQVSKGRYIAKVTSPTTYEFKYEVSTGGDYATVMEGKATKQ